jgi:hypothetical protein
MDRSIRRFGELVIESPTHHITRLIDLAPD